LFLGFGCYYQLIGDILLLMLVHLFEIFNDSCKLDLEQLKRRTRPFRRDLSDSHTPPGFLYFFLYFVDEV